jgi:DNA polymerase-3 subunit delta'
MIGQSADANISIEEIRKLQSDIIIKPMYSKRKVYFIADSDRMTVQAQNCLLKVLEEPPHYAVLLLTTYNSNALLETIRSRTQKCNFKKNTYDEIRGLLQSRFGSNLRNIDFIASFSDGVIGNALELAESEEFGQLRDNAMGIVFRLARSGLEGVFDIYDYFEANKNSIDSILDIMLLVYRDMLVSRTSGNENILINSDKKDIILSNAQEFSMLKLSKNMEIIEEARRNIKQNANFQLSIEVMLMKLQED